MVRCDLWSLMVTACSFVQVFFKTWRHMPKTQRHQPVMVHINYHPNKEERMMGIIEYFASGKDDAIMRFPGGSEPGT